MKTPLGYFEHYRRDNRPVVQKLTDTPAHKRLQRTAPSVPRNCWQGVSIGAWVRFNGTVWQVWSHARGNEVWLANGERYCLTRVNHCEVLGQAHDEPLFEVA